MPTQFDIQATALRDAVQVHSQGAGAKLVESTAQAARLVLSWLAYIRSSRKTATTVDRLLDGVQSAVIETAGCLSLGLARPAVFAIRAQIDMALAWVYFSEHPVEWKHLERTGEGSRLRAEVLKYLNTYYPRFHERYELLLKTRTRSQEEPYDLLSAHVHSQVAGAAPTFGSLAALVEPSKCDECVTLQNEVAEYLGDLLTACHAQKWQDLPTEVTDALKARLSAPHLKELCR